MVGFKIRRVAGPQPGGSSEHSEAGERERSRTVDKYIFDSFD
jgi:hypothetical protein